MFLIFFVFRRPENDENGSFYRKNWPRILESQKEAKFTKILIIGATASASERHDAKLLDSW